MEWWKKSGGNRFCDVTSEKYYLGSHFQKLLLGTAHGQSTAAQSGIWLSSAGVSHRQALSVWGILSQLIPEKRVSNFPVAVTAVNIQSSAIQLHRTGKLLFWSAHSYCNERFGAKTLSVAIMERWLARLRKQTSPFPFIPTKWKGIYHMGRWKLQIFLWPCSFWFVLHTITLSSQSNQPLPALTLQTEGMDSHKAVCIQHRQRVTGNMCCKSCLNINLSFSAITCDHLGIP